MASTSCLCEWKVALEGDGPRLRIGLGESAVNRTFEIESIRGEKKLVSVLLFTAAQVIPGSPPAEHALDARTVSDLKGRG